MEDVVGDFIVDGVLSDLFGGPVSYGVDFVGVVGEVFLDDLDFRAFHTLVAAQAGDPGVGFVEGYVEWVYLAYLAAELTVLNAFVEEIHACWRIMRPTSRMSG